MGSYRVNVVSFAQAMRSPGGIAAVQLQRRMLRVENTAKTLCPVDTGRLRSSITHTPVRRTPNGVIASIGSNVVYAAAIHDPEGHGPPSWRNNPPPARPYLRNALPAANPNRIE